MAQQGPGDYLLSLPRKISEYAERFGKESPKSSAHDKAVAEINKAQRAKDVAAATASFAKKGVGQKPAVAKSKARRGQRKVASKRYAN